MKDYLQNNWPTIGPKLVGKLHLYCGDMDNFYLNLAVYRLEDFLKRTNNPPYGGSVEYGRPMKGHGWTPLNQAELLRVIANHITLNAPKEAGGGLEVLIKESPQIDAEGR